MGYRVLIVSRSTTCAGKCSQIELAYQQQFELLFAFWSGLVIPLRRSKRAWSNLLMHTTSKILLENSMPLPTVSERTLPLRCRFCGRTVASWWVISGGVVFLLKRVRFGYGYSEARTLGSIGERIRASLPCLRVLPGPSQRREDAASGLQGARGQPRRG